MVPHGVDCLKFHNRNGFVCPSRRILLDSHRLFEKEPINRKFSIIRIVRFWPQIFDSIRLIEISRLIVIFGSNSTNRTPLHLPWSR